MRHGLALHAGLRRERRELLERRDELGPAIRVPRIVHRVDADEDVARAEHFRPRQARATASSYCARVRRSPECRWSASSGTSIERSVSAEPPMPARSTRITRCSTRAQLPGDRAGRIELGRMALPVVDGERVALEPLRARDRQRGRRIEPAREQHDRRCHLTSRRHCPTDTCAAGSGTAPASRSSRIQSARSRAGSCSWLGENSTVQRAVERRAREPSPGSTRSPSRSQMTNFTRSCARKQRELVVAIAMLFRRGRRLHVHDADDARVHAIERHRPAGFERHAIARIAQRSQQLEARSSARAARRPSRTRIGYPARGRAPRIASSSHHSPPVNAYAVSQYWQRSGQPVSRMNVVGIPAVSASPCRE